MRNGDAIRTVDHMRYRDRDRQKPPPTGSAAWARAFAMVYEPFLWVGERRGAGATRRELLGQARGHTVEIGAGTGLNLPHYPQHLDSLILTEPDPAMRSRLARKLESSGRPARVVDAPAERLPFKDQSVDTVVSTYVLCTVGAPDLVGREIVRVLRPGGQLLFIEHVRSDSAFLASWQDRLARPWRRFARGCCCNRATAELIAASDLELEQVRQSTWRGMPPIVRPLITGRARPRVKTDDTGPEVAERAWSATPIGSGR
jgi:SAM-dependent methyltransferase